MRFSARSLAAFMAAPIAALWLLSCMAPLAAQEGASADPERIAAARELMDVTGINTQLDGMIKAMGQGFRTGANDAGGAGAAEAMGKEFDRFMARLMTYRDAMLNEFAVLYAERFTVDELKAVTAFYRTQPGQKFIKSSPELMQAGAQIGIKYSRRAMQDMRESKP